MDDVLLRRLDTPLTLEQSNYLRETSKYPSHECIYTVTPCCSPVSLSNIYEYFGMVSLLLKLLFLKYKKYLTTCMDLIQKKLLVPNFEMLWWTKITLQKFQQFSFPNVLHIAQLLAPILRKNSKLFFRQNTLRSSNSNVGWGWKMTSKFFFYFSRNLLLNTRRLRPQAKKNHNSGHPNVQAIIKNKQLI